MKFLVTLQKFRNQRYRNAPSEMKQKIRHIMVVLMSLAVIAGVSSCRSSKKTVKESHVGFTEDVIRVHKGDKTAEKIVEEALSWVGTPYKYASMEKKKGTDCSGLVMKVFEEVTGRKLPRNSAKQAEFCDQVQPKDVVMGDLVFFATGKDPLKVSHVGIMVEDSKFVHASSSKGVVVSNITSPYYQRTFLMFGRVPESEDTEITSK